MARGVNKVILIGNLGNDPEIRYMPSGGAVANISIATSDSWRDKQSGEMVDRTEWHRVVFFNRLAEIVGEHLHKGSQVYVEGALQTRKWQDKEGKDRYTTEIVAREMKMLGSKNGGSDFEAHAEPAPAAAKPSEEPAPAAGAPETTEEFDDDIPF